MEGAQGMKFFKEGVTFKRLGRTDKRMKLPTFKAQEAIYPRIAAQEHKTQSSIQLPARNEGKNKVQKASFNLRRRLSERYFFSLGRLVAGQKICQHEATLIWMHGSTPSLPYCLLA